VLGLAFHPSRKMALGTDPSVRPSAESHLETCPLTLYSQSTNAIAYSLSLIGETVGRECDVAVQGSPAATRPGLILYTELYHQHWWWHHKKMRAEQTSFYYLVDEFRMRAWLENAWRDGDVNDDGLGDKQSRVAATIQVVGRNGCTPPPWSSARLIAQLMALERQSSAGGLSRSLCRQVDVG
jgi:hypothetical protein